MRIIPSHPFEQEKREMGLSRMAGPAYGAKGVLATFSPSGVTSTGASTALLYSCIVPTGEDWFVSEFQAFCSTASSGGNTLTFKSEGGSTTGAVREWGDGSNSTKAQTIGTLTWGASTTGSVFASVTPTAGEYEGKWVPTGSTLRVLLSVSANAMANLNVQINGFRRFVSSTRAES